VTTIVPPSFPLFAFCQLSILILAKVFYFKTSSATHSTCAVCVIISLYQFLLYILTNPIKSFTLINRPSSIRVTHFILKINLLINFKQLKRSAKNALLFYIQLYYFRILYTYINYYLMIFPIIFEK